MGRERSDAFLELSADISVSWNGRAGQIPIMESMTSLSGKTPTAGVTDGMHYSEPKKDQNRGS